MANRTEFDWRAHVRKLAEEGGTYPHDIALDVIDQLVSNGDINIEDEASKEIAFTEAVNYAENYFAGEGYEF